MNRFERLVIKLLVLIYNEVLSGQGSSTLSVDAAGDVYYDRTKEML